MIIFETQRLIIKSLERKDQKYFNELLSDPKIIDPIPQKRLTERQILDKFHENLNLKSCDLQRQNYTCGIFEKGNPEMIGLALFLTNDENDKELGYRFRFDYWGKGYGKEVTKGILDHYFNTLKVEKVTADVNIENVGSANILEKFMKPVNEFFNESRNCMVRRYQIGKKDWL